MLKKSGPKPIYQEEVRAVLKRIWFASDQLCGKRLKAALPHWLPHYEKEYGALAEPLKEKLAAISAATIDRLLSPVRAKARPKGRGGTKPGRWLKNQIPLATKQWDEHRPGFMEADTVAHCGDSLEGDFIWSLCFTDLATGWTELRAVWNKGSHGIMEAVRDIEATLPFAILGFDCDNGSEFLNHHLWRYFARRKEPVQFTRSRPYHKNDNAHVEQKNWTHVRCLLGYERLENPELLGAINALYRDAWALYHNHFCPSVKLVEKRREGARQIKRYDQPTTPYQRLLKSAVMDEQKRAALGQQHAALNPFALKRQIEAGLREIQRLVCAGKRSRDSVTLLPSLRSGTRSTASSERCSKPNLTTKVA
ncbi:MAG TPA: ISNCY family transposase [Candidatus Limnocylindrales bacterium]|nr:ISNCY family transposase [Candidatus Limnocylindrales bacterium]